MIRLCAFVMPTEYEYDALGSLVPSTAYTSRSSRTTDVFGFVVLKLTSTRDPGPTNPAAAASSSLSVTKTLPFGGSTGFRGSSPHAKPTPSRQVSPATAHQFFMKHSMR